MDSLESRFAKRLLELRLKAGITQQELAEKANISVRALSYLENAENGCKFSNLEPLANGVGVKVKDLFDF